MLVLTRRPGESVMVGDDVVITVLDVRGDVVRLGIKAPRSTQVHREEVYRELQSVNRAAASPSDLAVRALARMLHPDSDSDPGPDQDQPNQPDQSTRPEQPDETARSASDAVPSAEDTPSRRDSHSPGVPRDPASTRDSHSAGVPRDPASIRDGHSARARKNSPSA